MAKKGNLLDVVADLEDKRIGGVARACVAALGVQLRALKTQILEFDRQIMIWHLPQQLFPSQGGFSIGLGTAIGSDDARESIGCQRYC